MQNALTQKKNGIYKVNYKRKKKQENPTLSCSNSEY